MSFSQATAKIKGIGMTIMSNGRRADPLDEFAQAIKSLSGKRNKSDEDHRAMSLLEWEGSLYLTDKGTPCWPAINVQVMVSTAAKKSKEGVIAKTHMFIEEDCPIEYEGPKTVDGLRKDSRFMFRKMVPQRDVRIARSRACFRDWALTMRININLDYVKNWETVLRWLQTAGHEIGLSDERPFYGKFTVTSFKAGGKEMVK